MKKPSFRPVLTAIAAACLLPAAVHAQTTLQSPGGRLGESAAQPAGQTTATPMSTPMGTSMTIPVSPAQSISQPFSPVSSAADQREGLQFRVRGGVERDDNVTRVNVGEISDTITNLGVGLRYQKRVSQQQFVVDAQVDRYSYDTLNADYTTLNYSAAWMFRFGNRIEGVASADRRQFRDVTANGTTGIINRRTERTELVEGGYRLGADWRVLAGLQQTTTDSSDPTSWDANQRVTSTRLGASYTTPRGSSVTTRWRHGEGEYRNAPVAGDFSEDEVDATVRWAVSPITTVEGRLGHLSRDHDGALAPRDFSGVVGGINATYDVTAKTRIQAGYARDLGTYLEPSAASGHLSSDRWYIGPSFRFTEQTTLNARYEHETRRFEDVRGLAGAAIPDTGRRDKYNVLSAGIDWQVRRTIGVSLQLRNEKRSSTLPQFDYRANVIGLTARLTI